MSATTEQQLAELRRANETLQQERDAARAELRACVEQTAAADLAFVKAENEELRAAQAAGLEVLQTMAASPGMTEPVFDLIARQAAKLCDAPIAMVGMFDGAMLHLITQSGFDDAYTAVFASQFPRPPSPDFAMGRAILSGRIEEIENTGTPDRNGFKPPPGPGSALAVPLMRNGTPLGVIAVGRRVTGPFPRNQVTLLRTFAEQAVIAITSSETYRALAQRNSEYGERIEHQSATIDVLKAMAASPGDAQPVFDLITRRARDLCNAPSVVLFEYDGAFVYLRSECGTVSGSGRDALEAYKRLFPLVPTRASISCRAILDRKIIHIRDMKSEPSLLGVVRDLGHRSNLVVPLMRGDAAIGAVSLSSWEVGGFAESQVELMKTFAEQAVIAITSAETYRALQDRTSDLEESLKYQTATSDVLSVISRSTFDLQPVLESLVTTAANLCDAEMAAIIRCEGPLFRLMASRGFPADFVADRYARGATQARAATVTGRAARERRVIHIHDIAAEPDYPEDSIAVGKQRSSLGVPLLREDDVVGVILLSRQRVQPFTDRQIELVRTFADQAVIAMENARLLDELHQRSTDLQESLDYQTAISDVLRVISGSTFDLAPVFETVAATAVRLCRAHQAGIYLRQDDKYRWAGGFSQLPDYEKIEREIRIQPGSGTLVGRVALEGRAVQILDAWTDPLYEAKEDAQVGAIHTLLGVPLLRDGQTLGVIGIGRQEIEPFTERQIELVSTFADQAVIAIENARLLEELREALEQQTATAEVLQVINASPGDLAPVFDAILEKAHIVCGAEYGALLTYDGELFWPAAMHGDRLANSEAFRRGIRPGSGFSKLLRGERLLHVHDMAELAAMTPDDPIPRALVDINGIRTQLAVPLRRDGKLLGVITANRREVRPFSGKEITLLENFASQAVIAMENARLINETREALERQTATAEVLQVINASPGDLVPVFDEVLEKAVRLCNSAFGILITYDGKAFHSAAMRGVAPPLAEFLRSPVRPRPSGTLERVVRGEDVVQVADITDDDAYRIGSPARRALADLGGARTQLLVALRTDEKLLGAFHVFRQEVRPFSTEQIALLKNFAAQAVIAMENARLITETREALAQQTATAEVLRVINLSPGDIAPVFDAILEKAHSLCGATKGAFLTFDGQHFPVAATRGLSDAYTRVLQSNSHRQIKAGYAPGEVSPREQLVNGADLVQLMGQDVALGPVGRAAAELEEIRTVLFVPLRRDGRLLGYITAYRQEEAPFSDKQIAVLQSFAAQAVIAMENARLITETREALEQQTAVADVLQVINASPGDLGPVFDVILEKAVSLCEASLGVLHRYDAGVMLPLAARGPSGMTEAVLETPLNVDSGTAVERLLHGEPIVHIADVTDTDTYRSGVPSRLKLVEMTGARTALWVALRKDASFIGTLVIYRTEVRPFSPKEIALVENFAAQAVIAMENARLLDELRARTAELARRNSEYGERIEHQSATIDVLKTMSNSPDDTHPVFDLIVRRAVQLCKAESGGLFEYDGNLVSIGTIHGLYEQNGELIHVGSVRGNEQDIAPSALAAYLRQFPMPPKRGSISMRAILDNQILHIRDMKAEDLLDDVRRLGHRSQVSVPLRQSGRAVGVITMAAHEPGGFSESQVELLKTFAEQAVIAMTSVANFRALRERTADLTRSVNELQALEEVLRAVNSSLDLDTVLATIISRAVQLSNADEGTIYEFDKAQGVFVPKSGYGMSTDWLAQLRDRRIRIGETPLGRSAAMQAPLHIPDLAEEPDDGSKNELLARGVRAMLAVPLLREDEVIGGLVIRRHTAGGFGASTATLLQTFAAQSVLAIENARLFRDAERERAAAETALSDLRRAQDRLVQSEKMASLGQLTAGIAHEIKNPLNFVNNFAELSVDLLDELHDAVTSNLATESEEIAALLKSNLARIAEHGRRADSIVKNMLLHSRSGPSESRSVDLNAVVEEAMNLAYHGARAETPGFNITIERKLDPAAGTVEMFPQDFTRVMLNLISNGFYAAKQHADRNGSGAFVPVLTLTTRDQGNQVEIRVRDNGTGIASDVREKIFEPFFTTKPAGEGTGLGLSLSYDIVVKQHGGQLIVDSRPNEFTEFCITLPRRLAAHEGASA